MVDYLDVLANITGGRAPSGLSAMQADPAQHSGLLDFSALSQRPPSGLADFSSLSGRSSGGLLDFSGLSNRQSGGLLDFSGLSGPGVNAFELLKGIAKPWTRKGLDPVWDAQDAARAAAQATPAGAARAPGATGAAGVVPATIPESARTLISEAATASGLGVPLLAAVMAQESIDFNPDVMAGRRNSPAGAIGPMQLMPATAAGLHVDPFDPRANAIGGARYLAGLLKDYGGDLQAALVAYNGGDRAVQRWRAGQPFEETREYLTQVNRRMGEYQQAQTTQRATAGQDGGQQGGSPFQGSPFRISFGFNEAYGSAQFNPNIPNHRGVDLKPVGGWTRSTPVTAMRGGTVEYIASDPNGGLGVMIRDGNGLLNAYFHLGAAAEGLRIGQAVQPGQLIAYGGGNEDHLHLEVRRGGRGDPMGQTIDPLGYFNLR